MASLSPDEEDDYYFTIGERMAAANDAPLTALLWLGVVVVVVVAFPLLVLAAGFFDWLIIGFGALVLGGFCLAGAIAWHVARENVDFWGYNFKQSLEIAYHATRRLR